MKKEAKKKIKKIFESFPEIKLAYFFGSRKNKEEGPLSDYDFAVYIDEKVEKTKRFNLKLKLISKIGKILKTEDIDLVVINDVKNTELKYNIIKEGELFLEREPYKLKVEPKIFSEYFDFKALLKKYNLTEVK